MKVAVEMDLDLATYGYVEKDKLAEAFKELSELYAQIWIEAVYDPYNEHYKKFAKKLLPHIQKANDLLEFRK